MGNKEMVDLQVWRLVFKSTQPEATPSKRQPEATPSKKAARGYAEQKGQKMIN